jgi:hypothetical protein
VTIEKQVLDAINGNLQAVSEWKDDVIALRY